MNNMTDMKIFGEHDDRTKEQMARCMTIGSVVGGAIVWVLTPSDIGMLAMLLIGCGGAALTIAAQRGLWRSAKLGT